MSVESATYISGLNASNPGSGDSKAEGDDHIRLIKTTVKATFPNVSGAVTPTHTVINNLAGGTFASVPLTGVTDVTMTGLLGVGGASTGSPLYVTGSSTGQLANLNSTAANGGYMAVQRSGTTQGYIGSAAQIISGGSTSDLGIRSEGALPLSSGGAAERMRVMSTGEVVVGATSNSGIGGGVDKLAVSGSIGLSGAQINANPGAGTALDIVNRSSGGMRMYVNSGGLIGLQVSTTGLTTAAGMVVGNGGTKGIGNITTTTSTSTPTGGSAGDLVLIY